MKSKFHTLYVLIKFQMEMEMLPVFFFNTRCDVVEIAAEDGLEIDSYQDLAIARCIINSNL